MAKRNDMPGGPGGAEDWVAYFDAVKGLPARETLVAALDRFEADGSRGRAGAANDLLCMDLGCGDGRDTVELLRRGWRVVAIDSHPEGIARLTAKIEQLPIRNQSLWLKRLQTVVGRFEDVTIPSCDLVNASFSIPHCSPADFPLLWSKIVGSIRVGGRFAGQLFGINDGWAKRPDGVTRTYHTRAEVEAMLAPFDLDMLDEVERPGKTAMGEPKYWHVFHIVAKKR
jgi:tellurite methyltransferase